MNDVIDPATGLPLRYPSSAEEVYARAQEFRRLSPQERFKQIAELMEIGMNMVRTSPSVPRSSGAWKLKRRSGSEYKANRSRNMAADPTISDEMGKALDEDDPRMRLLVLRLFAAPPGTTRPQPGPRLIARGVSPWYAGATTLKYNAALYRAEVPLRRRERRVRKGLALFAVPGANEPSAIDRDPDRGRGVGESRVACVMVPGATSPWLLTVAPFGARSKTAQHQNMRRLLQLVSQSRPYHDRLHISLCIGWVQPTANPDRTHVNLAGPAMSVPKNQCPESGHQNPPEERSPSASSRRSGGCDQELDHLEEAGAPEAHLRLASSSSVSPASTSASAFLRSTRAQAISHGSRTSHSLVGSSPTPRFDLLEHGPGRLGIDQGQRERGLGREAASACRDSMRGSPAERVAITRMITLSMSG